MEVAAMMYGISLNKDGTTKVVAQRLEHQTSLETDARLEGAGSPAAGDDRVIDVEAAEADGAQVPAGERVG
jgi:hypothetical protein